MRHRQRILRQAQLPRILMHLVVFQPSEWFVRRQNHFATVILLLIQSNQLMEVFARRLSFNTHPIAVVVFFLVLVDARVIATATLYRHGRVKGISHLFLLFVVAGVLANTIPAAKTREKRLLERTPIREPLLGVTRVALSDSSQSQNVARVALTLFT